MTYYLLVYYVKPYENKQRTVCPVIVLGADPGVAPAFALYGGPTFSPIVFPPMGVTRGAKKVVAGKSKDVSRVDPDVVSILGIFDTYRPDLFGVENVGMMPGQGISSAGRFLHSAGLITGIALGKGCRVTKVLPQVWKKAFKMPPGKEVSRQYCVRLFPYLADVFKLVKSHNEADSLLIAVYLWCAEMGVPVPQC